MRCPVVTLHVPHRVIFFPKKTRERKTKECFFISVQLRNRLHVTANTLIKPTEFRYVLVCISNCSNKSFAHDCYEDDPDVKIVHQTGQMSSRVAQKYIT